MLGDRIGEERGKVISTRVLSVEGPPRLEVSFHAFGELLGVILVVGLFAAAGPARRALRIQATEALRADA